MLADDPDSTDLHLADTLARRGRPVRRRRRAGARRRGTGPGQRADRPGRDVRPRRAGPLAARPRGRPHAAPRRPRRRRGHRRRDRAGAGRGGAARRRPRCREQWFALDLLVDGGRCVGVAAMRPDGRSIEIRSRHVLLATGGAGQLFAVTTNPLESTGDGLAMALRAGVAVRRRRVRAVPPDRAASAPRCRGRCCPRRCAATARCIRDPDGERFVDELLPRDVVSRAMTQRDARAGRRPPAGSTPPGSSASTSASRPSPPTSQRPGSIPPTDWLPIAPAAHYLCGGVVTDLDGASSLPGLWAAGEVACSGVHGANRLASQLAARGHGVRPRVVEAIGPRRRHGRADGCHAGRRPRRGQRRRDRRAGGRAAGTAGRRARPRAPQAELRDRLQRAMTRGAGVLRDARLARRDRRRGGGDARRGRRPARRSASARSCATWPRWAGAPARRRGARGEPGLPHPGGPPRPRPRVPAPPGPALTP